MTRSACNKFMVRIRDGKAYSPGVTFVEPVQTSIECGVLR
jgi:hypothetical protein